MDEWHLLTWTRYICSEAPSTTPEAIIGANIRIGIRLRFIEIHLNWASSEWRLGSACLDSLVAQDAHPASTCSSSPLTDRFHGENPKGQHLQPNQIVFFRGKRPSGTYLVKGFSGRLRHTCTVHRLFKGRKPYNFTAWVIRACLCVQFSRLASASSTDRQSKLHRFRDTNAAGFHVLLCFPDLW